MASQRAMAWIDRLVWTFIYAGLFAVVLGLAALQAHAVVSWTLIALGAVLVIAGVVLIAVRARLGAGQ